MTAQTTSGSATIVVTTANGTGTHTISSALSLASNLTMSHTSTANFTLSGSISGTGRITKTGTGTGALVLSAVNSYSGGTTINEGFLNSSANGALPAGSTVTIGDGTIPSASLRVTANMTMPNAFNATVNSDGTLVQNNNITTYLSSLQGSGTVSLSTGTNNNSLFDIRGSSSTSYSGVMSGGATSTSLSPQAGNRVIKAGTSTLTLSGSSTHTSRIFIEEGIILARSNGSLGAAGTNSGVFIRATGTQGRLDLENNINLPKRVFLNGSGFSSGGALRNLSENNIISGNVQIGWTGGTETASNVTINVQPASTLTLSGIISGSNELNKVSTGTLLLSGTSSNTLNGSFNVNAGTVQLNKTAGLNAIAGNVFIASEGTLELLAANQIINAGIVTVNGGTFNLGGNAETIASLVYNSGIVSQGGATLTIAGTTATALSMGDNTTLSGSITFTSNGGVTYTGIANTATITGNVNLGSSAHTFNIANGSATADMDIQSIISGAGSITKSTGTGQLRFSGSSANTYTGLTTLSAGEISLAKTAGITAIAGNITLNTGGTLTLEQSEQIANTSTITLGGGTFDLGPHSETINSLVFNNGTLNQSGGTLFLVGTVATTLSMGNNTLIPGSLAFSSSGGVTYNWDHFDSCDLWECKSRVFRPYFQYCKRL